MEATGISVVRGQQWLLRDVDLALDEGHVTAVVGPNGAGKSTLLRVLSGEIAPAVGEVRILGRPLDRWRPQELARHRAILRQRYQVTADFSAEEVVRLGRSPYRSQGLSREDRAVARELLAEVGLEGFANRAYATLSGGEQQRVHLARVLAQLREQGPLGPPTLLLDEPTSSLDLLQQHSVLSLVAARARANGWRVMVVLHDLALAMRYADTVVMLDRGRVTAQGSPADVIAPAEVRRVFGVDAAIVTLENGSSGCIVHGVAFETADRPRGRSSRSE